MTDDEIIDKLEADWQADEDRIDWLWVLIRLAVYGTILAGYVTAIIWAFGKLS